MDQTTCCWKMLKDCQKLIAHEHLFDNSFLLFCFSSVFSEQFDLDKNHAPIGARLKIGWAHALVFRPGVVSSEGSRRHSLVCQSEKQESSTWVETQTLEPARKLWVTLFIWKIINPDWIVIFPMDNFISPLNNWAKFIASGCWKLVFFFTITWKEINSNKIFFP